MLGRFLPGREPRTLVGRIESADRHSEGDRSRSTFVLDAVNGNIAPSDGQLQLNDVAAEEFAVIRVMTTDARLAQMSGVLDLGSDALVGQWAALDLVPPGKKSGPIVQVCPLGPNGYGVGERYTLDGISIFGEAPEFPRDLGAAGNSTKKIAADLSAAGRMFNAGFSRSTFDSVLHQIGNKILIEIEVKDVGQANFSTVFSFNREAVLHFDVGWPVGFNLKTVTGRKPVIHPAPLVVLSHWDWDHLQGYYIWPALGNKMWIAPVQDLGPGALRVAQSLRAAGRLLSLGPSTLPLGSAIQIGGVSIGFCDPSLSLTKSQFTNNSGLFLAVRLSSGKTALLPGDADYHSVNWCFGNAPELLLVSHHGARISGNVQVPPKGIGDAVVSFGVGNVYRHPSEKALRDLQRVGWHLSYTSSRSGVARGDRQLL